MAYFTFDNTVSIYIIIIESTFLLKVSEERRRAGELAPQLRTLVTLVESPEFDSQHLQWQLITIC